MDFTHLQLFRDIVQSRSISRGAHQNGITQSAASQAVQEMERVLDTQLLDRSRRPLEVTEAGRLLYDLSRDVLRRRQEFEIDLEQVRSVRGGSVKVAAIYSVGLFEMARLESIFLERLPEGQLNVDYLRPERVYQAVADDHTDLGLVSYPESTREVLALPWRQERMVVALSPDHPLANRTEFAPEDLDQQEMIGFDQDLPISRDIDRYLREHGAKAQITLHFDNIQSMKEALRFGNAMGILPEPMLEPDASEGRLKAVPLAKPLFRPLGILQRRRRTLSRAAQIFLEVLQNQTGK